jgi:5-methylcytosine-specific restriction protein A
MMPDVLNQYAGRLTENLSLRLEVDLIPSVEMYSGGYFAAFRFADLEKPNGLTFLVSSTPSRIGIEVILDPYARTLLRNLSTASGNDIFTWASVATKAEKIGVKINLEINGVSRLGPFESTGEDWDFFELECSQRQNRGTSKEERWSNTISVAEIAVSLVLCLLEIEELNEAPEFIETGPVISSLGEVEGRKLIKQIHSYERSRKNRAACLAEHGYSCFSCGLNFGEVYGERGVGYIEVHHREPVSLMAEPRALDPKLDLVPLCANCHRMVHRSWPPMSPEGLSQLVSKLSNFIERD